MFTVIEDEEHRKLRTTYSSSEENVSGRASKKVPDSFTYAVGSADGPS
jgi:hypothetical protein